MLPTLSTDTLPMPFALSHHHDAYSMIHFRTAQYAALNRQNGPTAQMLLPEVPVRAN